MSQIIRGMLLYFIIFNSVGWYTLPETEINHVVHCISNMFSYFAVQTHYRYLLHLAKIRATGKREHSRKESSSSSKTASATSVKRSNIPKDSENQNIENEENTSQNNVTEGISTVRSKVPDSKGENSNEEVFVRDDRNENSAKKEKNPSSFSSAQHLKRKSRQSILLPFMNDMSSPESSPMRDRKSNVRQLSRRMTLSPASARSLMMQVMEDDDAREKSVTPTTVSPINPANTIVIEREGSPPTSSAPARLNPSGPIAVHIKPKSQSFTNIKGPSPIRTMHSPSLSKINEPLTIEHEVSACRDETNNGDMNIDDGPCVAYSMKSIRSDAIASTIVSKSIGDQDIAVEGTEEIVEQSQGTMNLQSMEFQRTEECVIAGPLESADSVDLNGETASPQICVSTSPVELLSTHEIVRTSPEKSTCVSTSRTYSVELDALLDSDSDVSTSTSSSTLASDSFSAESSTGNRENFFADFCASSDGECASSPLPIEVQYISKERECVRKEDSFDVLFPNDAPSDCAEVIEMDTTEESRVLLNSAFAVDRNGGESVSVRNSSPSSSPSPLSIVVTGEESSIDSKSDNNMEVIVDAEHEEKLSVRKRVQDILPHESPVKKTKIAENISTNTDYVVMLGKEKVPDNSLSHSNDHRVTTTIVPVLKTKEVITCFNESHHLMVSDTQGTATTTSVLIGMDSSSANRVESHRTLVGPESVTVSDEPDSTGCASNLNFPSCISLAEAHQRALGRLNIRQDTALWKYHWEIASFCAAQAAREKKAEV